MKYLVVDTNIWIRVISQGKPGCEIAHFDDLRQLVEGSKITLLLPEVIRLELEKNWRSFADSVEFNIGKLEKELDTILGKTYWNEIEDVQKSLRAFLLEQKAKKVRAASERYANVQRLLSSPNVVEIPFTHDINFRGRKRLMAGRMPKPEHRAHSDACIIESLAVYFSTLIAEEQHELYFCSENVGDFGLAAKDRHIIHPIYKDDLPAATEYCISLEKVVSLVKSQQKAVPPSPTVIDEALKLRTEDELAAQAELDQERKPVSICAEPNCYATRFIVSRYCEARYEIRLSKLSVEQRKTHHDRLSKVLMTLTYREREILKLRWGLGNGYVYTSAECARIFKITPQRVGQIEAKAIRKLQHPVRSRVIDGLLA